MDDVFIQQPKFQKRFALEFTIPGDFQIRGLFLRTRRQFQEFEEVSRLGVGDFQSMGARHSSAAKVWYSRTTARWHKERTKCVALGRKIFVAAITLFNRKCNYSYSNFMARRCSFIGGFGLYVSSIEPLGRKHCFLQLYLLRMIDWLLNSMIRPFVTCNAVTILY